MNEQHNEREARIERATKFLDLQSYGSLIPETRRLWTAWLIGFAEQEIELAGAASVDRVEMVREAFEEVKTYLKSQWLFDSEFAQSTYKAGDREQVGWNGGIEKSFEAMDEAIAAMEKGR